ncbi:NAD(P)-binding protein [Schizophyllum commune H4-8]|uniref:NAD-dependent epimerase/dehydratase domain-containing protein n=1 Tax=Schizophyllum commune (strain H4-8 / FGSC 9210) TaxID=578458 RepID=D8QBS9_SCHCM|nr:NAD(P)-binding protein [Schizophyllum commune H4-8]KAI5889299.1 NAD(P)-binding protein [Schizophyllum commune H4-8]
MKSPTHTSSSQVTGASGYIAFAVVHELLEKGYRVRGSARGGKVATLQSIFAKYPLFEAVEVADIASSDLSDVFKGVDKLIHMAAPLVGRATPKEATFKLGIHGTVHVLNHAAAAGIKKIVVTAPLDFNSVTIEAASAPDSDPWLAYAAEKTFTEKAVVEFGEKHPEIDISIGTFLHFIVPRQYLTYHSRASLRLWGLCARI